MQNGAWVVSDEGVPVAKSKKMSVKSASNPWAIAPLVHLGSRHRSGTVVSLPMRSHSEEEVGVVQARNVLVYDRDAQ